MAIVLLRLSLVAIVATAVVWLGSTRLESASAALAEYYGLPAVVTGAMVLAVGSSAPELASVVIATLRYGSFDLGVGAIVGSAIFNVLVIPALAGLSVPADLAATRAVVYKEAQFYMLAVAVVFLTFALATIYYPIGGDALLGQLTRPIALLPIALYALYVFVQYQDVSDHDAPGPPEDLSPLRAWGSLALGVVLIVVAVEGLVYAAVGFGDYFGTPSFLWGLTVVAVSTSLPDAIVSVRAARTGEATASFANVLGSNTFDLTVAIPLGVLIAGTATVDFGASVPMFGALTLATVLLFGLLRTDLELTGIEAASLLVAYGVFVAWITLEVVGVVGLVPGV